MPLATTLPSLLPPATPNDLATLLPLSLFAFVTSITPGPNNLMLTASSIRFGFQRTIFHMLGILFGLSVMLALFGSGVGGLILAVPAAHSMLKFASACYLVYLAWQMRKMGFADADRACDGARPLSFANAALFQLANPKAWMMALTAAASFMPALHPGLALDLRAVHGVFLHRRPLYRSLGRRRGDIGQAFAANALAAPVLRANDRLDLVHGARHLPISEPHGVYNTVW